MSLMGDSLLFATYSDRDDDETDCGTNQKNDGDDVYQTVPWHSKQADVHNHKDNNRSRGSPSLQTVQRDVDRYPHPPLPLPIPESHHGNSYEYPNTVVLDSTFPGCCSIAPLSSRILSCLFLPCSFLLASSLSCCCCCCCCASNNCTERCSYNVTIEPHTHVAVYYDTYHNTTKTHTVTLTKPGRYFLPPYGRRLLRASTAVRSFRLMDDVCVRDWNGVVIQTGAVVTWRVGRVDRVGEVNRPWPDELGDGRRIDGDDDGGGGKRRSNGVREDGETYLELATRVVLDEVVTRYIWDEAAGFHGWRSDKGEERRGIRDVLVKALQKRVDITGAKILSVEPINSRRWSYHEDPTFATLRPTSPPPTVFVNGRNGGTVVRPPQMTPPIDDRSLCAVSVGGDGVTDGMAGNADDERDGGGGGGDGMSLRSGALIV